MEEANHIVAGQQARRVGAAKGWLVGNIRITSMGNHVNYISWQGEYIQTQRIFSDLSISARLSHVLGPQYRSRQGDISVHINIDTTIMSAKHGCVRVFWWIKSGHDRLFGVGLATCNSYQIVRDQNCRYVRKGREAVSEKVYERETKLRRLL